MSGEEVCKHNQSGYCKYKLKCQKRHENKLCPEEQSCNFKACLLRHPKTCKYFFREGICRFGEGCSYSHKKFLNQDPQIEVIKEKHEIEINAIKDEMHKLKEVISLMEIKIAELNQDLQSSNMINIEEIVGLVVSLLDNPKSFEKSSNAAYKNESIINCDICDFKSENKKQRETHMSAEHDDCYCCYLCDKYFETKTSFKYHNEFIHNEHSNLTESEGENTTTKNNTKVTQKVKNHAKKKKSITK